MLVNTQNVKNFYNTLISSHYYCEDDFKLKTKYATLLFIDTLFLDKNGFKGLNIAHAQQCEIYEYIANNKLKVFNYVCFKATAHNDLDGLKMFVDEFGKNNWIMILGYYVYNKALDLLNNYDDCFDIKQKVYAIICSLKVAQVETLCSACENDCSICLDAMDAYSTITTLCKHSFHIKCLYPMFDEAVKINETQPKISCPLCRADVFIKSKITFEKTTHYY